MRTWTFILVNLAGAALSAQNSWMPLNSGSARNLNALSFPDASTGYVVGERGAILKTTNAGQSWTSVFQDSTRDFFSVHFITPAQGYALSTHRLYGTTNGGSSWQALYTDSSVNLNVVHFVNASTGFIGTGNSILKSTNAGQSWTPVMTTLNQINTISFPSPSTGYFTGGSSYTDQMYKTTDQGQSFTNKTLNMQSIKERVFFLNNQVGYFTGWYGGALEKTSDGGQSWTTINTTNDTQGWDVHFSDELKGFYINNSGGASKIYKSVDGGHTWTVDATATSNTFLKFAFTTSGKAFAIGKSGGIYSKQVSVGLKELSKEKTLRIYPNPSAGTFSISSENDLEIRITDELGREIRNMKLNSWNAHACELSGLAQGVYFLDASYGAHSENHKILVQN